MNKEQVIVLKPGASLSFQKRLLGSQINCGNESLAATYGDTVKFVGFIPADPDDSYALVIQGQTVQGDCLGLPTLRVVTKKGQSDFSASWFD